MKKIIVSALASAALLFSVAGSPVSATANTAPAPIVEASSAPDPNTCTGYPEPRVGVEIQSWWQDRIGEAFPGRHIHIAVCWPTGVVSGVVHIDPILQAHAQPAGNYFKRLRATDGSSPDVFTPKTSGFVAFDASGNALQMVPEDIDTSKLSTGLHEIRLAAYVRQLHSTATTSDDFDQLVSSDLPLFVRSMSGGATSRDYVEARSWYPGFLYTNSRYRTRLSDFLTAKSGIWTPTLQCASPSGEDADQQYTNIDPHFHALDPGLQVGFFNGEGTHQLSINTAQLTNGVHTIVNRCAAAAVHTTDGVLHDGTSTGVLAIKFTVNN